jgi:hypothetical protein
MLGMFGSLLRWLASLAKSQRRLQVKNLRALQGLGRRVASWVDLGYQQMSRTTSALPWPTAGEWSASLVNLA